MKKFAVYCAVAALIAAFSGLTQAQDKKVSKSCCHMCPAAVTATKSGFEVVVKRPIYRASATELLS